MTEFELIQGLRNGDEAAFKYLVDTYKDRVFNTAIGIVQNAEDAEDVAQEVFIQVSGLFKTLRLNQNFLPGSTGSQRPVL